MNRYSQALGAIMAAAMLAACSGGGTASPTALSQQPHAVKTGKLTMTFHLPTKATKSPVRPNGKPKFVGAATTEIDFTLTAWNGGGSPPTGYNSTLYTQPNGVRNSNCRQDGYYGFQCSVTFQAPSATDTFNVQAKWCSAPNTDGSCPGAATLTLISEGNFTVVVPPGGEGNATLTLDPVVGKLVWAYYNTSWPNGTTAPTIVNGKYACASACYDPLLNDAPSSTYSTPGTPDYDGLTLLVEDADGDNITPVSGYGTQYNTPLYLTSTGAVDDITISCGSDAHLQYLNFDASNPDPSPVASTDLANGYTGATYAVVNSPYTQGDGTTTKDLSGNTVTVSGNNGYAVNFDGGIANYTTSSLETCTATDSSTLPLTATYSVGFAFGSVAIIDGRHRSRH